MKKAIIHVSLVIIFILTYFLQTTFFANFTIANVMPNIFIILILYIGLYMGRCMGTIYGIAYGIFLDIWIGRNIGITSACLAIIGLLGGVFDKNFSKDSRITIIIMGALCTIISEIINYVLRHIALGTNIEIMLFIKTLSIETLYNVLLIVILYPLIKNTGYEVENEIKGDRILTRYF